MELIIPARNEEQRLPRTLADLRDRLVQERRMGLPTGPVEVLVVDNASSDDTSAVAQAASTPEVPVRVTHCPTPGKGAAVRHGMALTTHRVVGFMDADGATDLDALRVARTLIAGGADVAVGSRAVRGSQTEVRHSRLRERGAAAFRAVARGAVPTIADTQCGFKLMRGDLARRVFSQVRTDGFSFDVEFLARAVAMGAHVEEFPVVWTDVPGSTFRPSRHGTAAFWEVARIRWWLRGAGLPATGSVTPLVAPTPEPTLGLEPPVLPVLPAAADL